MPAGWTEVPIGDVTDLKNGRAFKPAEWHAQGMPIVRIQNLNKKNAPFNYFLGALDERHRLRGGELLFAWSGTPGTSFGAHLWTGGDAALNQHIFRVDFDEDFFDRRFLKHAINQTVNDLIDIAHGGVGLGHVTKGKFEATKIAVAPRAEQQRIADKLDVILARIDACRGRLEFAESLLTRLKQSVLNAAYRGSLTEDWRNAGPRGKRLRAIVKIAEIMGQRVPACSAETAYNFRPLGEIGIVGGGLTKNSSRIHHAMQRPFLRVANVQSNALQLNDVDSLGMTDAEFARTRLLPGDLLIVEGNGSLDQIGRVSIWNDEIKNCSHQNHLIRWRAGEGIDPRFAMYCLLSPEGRKQIVKVASSTTGLHTLSLSKVAALQIPVPSIEEQMEIVRRVDRHLALADSLSKAITSGRADVDRLVPATLAKAFRGELVPQDPADEPAQAMLDRLNAEHPPDDLPRRRGRRATAA